MKDQYFGDLYDYVKYALVRRLSGNGETAAALCWMMTPGDGGNDGNRIGYLGDFERWRRLDPDVFDLLMAAVDRGERDTRIIERSGLLRNTKFHHYFLTRNPDTRQPFMDGFLVRTNNRPLLCYDPDTGIASHDPKPGTIAEPEHLLMREVAQAYEAQRSLLVFQNMSRGESHNQFVARTAGRLLNETEAAQVLVFRVPQNPVAFFLVPQEHHWEKWMGGRAEGDWHGGLLNVERYAKGEADAEGGAADASGEEPEGVDA